MIKKFCKLDDTLLSFLCGIFSSIPISLGFTFTALGDTVFKKIKFLLMIGAFAISIILMIFVYIFTLRKMKYISPVLREASDDEIDAKLTEYFKYGKICLEKKHKKGKLQQKIVDAKSYFVRPIVGFLLSAIVLFVIIIALWVVSNFIY